VLLWIINNNIELWLHVIDYLHELFTKGVGVVGCGGFTVDADYWFGVRFSKMNPWVGEIELHAVDIGYGNVGYAAVEFFDFCENGFDIGFGGEIDAVFCYEVFGEGTA